MFQRKKKVLVRILDSPRSMVIDPAFILVPLPDGKLLILHPNNGGTFETISDQEAFRLASEAENRMHVA